MLGNRSPCLVKRQALVRARPEGLALVVMRRAMLGDLVDNRPRPIDARRSGRVLGDRANGTIMIPKPAGSSGRR